MTAVDRSQLERRADYTHQHNLQSGRHGWLRLTPAYSVKIVDELIARRVTRARVFDPFCGSGTTALSAAFHGHDAATTDLNPFLAWLATIKSAHYSKTSITKARSVGKLVTAMVSEKDTTPHEPPPIHNIERWWSPEAIRFLCCLRDAVRSVADNSDPESSLLLVALCRTLMRLSNAAFNHQSMSFKDGTSAPSWSWAEMQRLFDQETAFVLKGAGENPAGKVEVRLADAKCVPEFDGAFDLVITSPPYANRMSYIRELRPYMYWLGYLKNGRDAGELDWAAIGGTWGIATSRLISWQRDEARFEDEHLSETLERIAHSDNRNGRILANYVAKYHDDMWSHFRSLTPRLNAGAEVNYIVGNSTFYGVLLPVERYYSSMLTKLGFETVKCIPIRKRNSKKELIEFNVCAKWP